MLDLPYLVALLPPEGRPVPVGLKVHWPHEHAPRVWDGTRWLQQFDGGDSWVELEDRFDEAA